MSKIYIMGGGGMLGDAFYSNLRLNHELLIHDIDVNSDWIKFGDIKLRRNIEEEILRFNPSVIINLAALTDLEYCEKNVIDAYKTNFEGVINLTKIASKLDCNLVHISTAGIFSGDKDFYTEDDLPEPLSVYGKSKYAGELAALDYKKSYVFRAGWMMGGLTKDKKFISKILKNLNNSKEVFVVTDKYGTPTYTYRFAETIMSYISKKIPYGLYNNVGNGECNRYDVAELLFKLLDIKNIKLIPCTSDHFSKEYFAERPKSEILINKKLKNLNLDLMNDWKIDLSNYCDKIKNTLL